MMYKCLGGEIINNWALGLLEHAFSLSLYLILLVFAPPFFIPKRVTEWIKGGDRVGLRGCLEWVGKLVMSS
jgi:hypothetical protein